MGRRKAFRPGRVLISTKTESDMTPRQKYLEAHNNVVTVDEVLLHLDLPTVDAEGDVCAIDVLRRDAVGSLRKARESLVKIRRLRRKEDTDDIH